MFKVREATIEELMEWSLSCQQNERAEEKLITAEGLLVSPLPPRIDIEKKYKKEWVSSEKKARNAWRFK